MMYRFVASKWPKQHRQPDVSLDIHRILIGAADPFEHQRPPLHPRPGKRRWTQDAAKRLVGWQVSHPQSVQEKVEVIHDLAADEQGAARVATGFLRRPEAALRAASDDTARHLFNKAQLDRSDQARERFDRESSVAPVVRQLRHTVEFLDLVGACHSFVSSAGKVVPSLQGRPLSGDERAVLHKNVAKVRAAADWIEGAIDTGEVDMDEELTRLLRGE
ncbi:DUF6192 family protein [Streptomyces sp. Ag82_O1-15]|uniref:DUF6192 family protein n=1 Tax=Streptomyces sp. Ag82_O1-15 TaxID=1938855 RepID=UPI0027B9D099|nr:DUF6192 family protein [Streptomyces sp. Ag82_O1-15]